jgi:hypothetical protein
MYIFFAHYVIYSKAVPIYYMLFYEKTLNVSMDVGSILA